MCHAATVPRFNEAAGIHRRKHILTKHKSKFLVGFNEAAGIHRRKRVRIATAHEPTHCASMRPPEFTGGNHATAAWRRSAPARFNEAAGIHRRKPMRQVIPQTESESFNEAAGIYRRKLSFDGQAVSRLSCFNEAAGIHRRKPLEGCVDPDCGWRLQ